ncbi:MAG TPA: zinc ABC transporter substrate-binding protein [Verrucomicrobiae bacterium]|nr:zinc ABC transporter substrate-binding protein [Verrucomicrobiae bacterium]
MTRILLSLALLVAATPALALNVFATVPEWGALARELGGGDVEVYVATTALQNVHRIQARPSLIAQYRKAQLVVATGADLESGWLPALAEKGNNPTVLPGTEGFFEAFRHVRMLEVPQVVDRSLGDVHPYGNPHIQTAAPNILAIAGPLSVRMAALDPAHAEGYRARFAAFEVTWRAALTKWEARAKPLAGVGVVSSHRDSSYLYAWLGLREVATLEPKPGIPPSAGHLEQVLSTLQATPARMALRAAYQDDKPARWISDRTGIPVVTLPFTVGGAPGTDDLYGYFDVTLQRLLDAAGTTAGGR